MSDFIREVDEDYRRERVVNFLRRFQVPLVLFVVLIIAGAGGWRWYVDRQQSRAQGADARYQSAEREARGGQPAEAERAFQALAADGPTGYALLSRLRAAEVMSDPEAAAKSLDAIASDDASGSQALRDLARYRGALLRIDHDDPKAFETRYGRFALEAFTFRDGMRELLALAALKRGDGPAAAKYLDAIILDPLSPPALRNRAQALRELSNGGPATPLVGPLKPASVTAVAGTGPEPAAANPPSDTIAPVETLPAPPAAASAQPAPAPPAPPIQLPVPPAADAPAPVPPAAPPAASPAAPAR